MEPQGANMTVDSSSNRKDYDPDGLVAIFAYDFRVDDADDMVVYEDGAVVVGGYTVSGIGVKEGGDVTFDVAPLASVEVLSLRREVPLTQETAYPTLGPFPSESHEAALDKLTMIAQQQKEVLSRSLTTAATSLVEPSVSNPEGGKVLRWKADETGLENLEITTEIVSYIESFNSIAAMKAASGDFTDRQVVAVLGYHSATENQPWEFQWRDADLSTEVSADAFSGVYVAIDSSPTGSAGAFVRLYEGNIFADWFGVIGDGTTTETDDSARIQAIIDGFPGQTIEFNYLKSHWLETGLVINDDSTHLYSPSLNINLFRSDQDIYMLTIDDCNFAQTTNIGLLNTHATPTRANMLIAGKAKNGNFQWTHLQGHKYGILFDGAQGSTPGGIFYNEFFHTEIVSPTDECVYFTDADGMNENYFWGGNFHNSLNNKIIRTSGNNNKFIGTSLESAVSGQDYTNFAITDVGKSVFAFLRFEVDGHGILVNDVNIDESKGTRIYGNYWASNTVRVAVKDGIAFTDTHGLNHTFSGMVKGGPVLSTTLDGSANVGQQVIPMTSTVGAYEGGVVVFDEGLGNEEWHIIDTVQAGASVTILGTVQANQGAGTTAIFYGQLNGMNVHNPNDPSVIEFFSQGALALKIDGIPGGADNSSLVLLDYDEGTMKQVSFGADDSGGAGYKVLRVLN